MNFEINKLLKIDDSNYFNFNKNCISSSLLNKLYSGCSRDLTIEKEETDALLFGKAFHCLVLEPECFNERFVFTPKFEPTDGKEYKNFKATKNYKEQLAEFTSNNYDKTIIPYEWSVQMNDMNARLHESKLMQEELNGGMAEMALFTEIQPELYAKIKMDYVVDDSIAIIYDLKTTSKGKANKHNWIKAVNAMNYDLQAAFYSSIYSAVFDKKVLFVWLVIEKEKPYNFAWYQAGKNIINNGLKKVAESIETYMETIAKDNYIGYGNGKYEKEITTIDYEWID